MFMQLMTRQAKYSDI